MEEVICILCNKGFKRITDMHLISKHGINFKMYVENFPFACTISNKTIEKLRNARVGFRHSEESKLKIRNSSLGKHHLEITKNIIGENFEAGNIPKAILKSIKQQCRIQRFDKPLMKKYEKQKLNQNML